MALLCVVAAYNEEGLLHDAIRSSLTAGADEVHVFDGAWRAGGHGPAFAAAKQPGSTDATAAVAADAGAIFHPAPASLWADQGAKRTAMFHQCGAGAGDHVFVLDADERVTGTFPPTIPPGPINVLLRSIGPNDLPGVRANFPRGDYRPTPRPALRVFAWTTDLECVCPGHYIAAGIRIEPYDGRGDSLLPLVDQVCIEHHPNLRDEDRLAAKRAYYAADHPQRRGRVNKAVSALRARPATRPRKRGTTMPEKRIADRRIYGKDAYGRDVLVAAVGQPIPPGFDVGAATTPTPAAAPQPPQAAPADATPDLPTADELHALTRADLDVAAGKEGVTDPDQLANKGAVVDAVLAKRAQAAEAAPADATPEG
jgi:hypothetical protein